MMPTNLLIDLHNISLTAINNLREVLSDVNEVAANWFTVGLFLNVPYSKLQVVKKNFSDCEECLREMLAVWLKGTEASPAALVQALRAAGSVALARKLAVKHGETRISGYI